MIHIETTTQEILVRLTDGVITGAMVTEQDLYIEASSYDLIGRSALRLRDITPQALADIATILDCELCVPVKEIFRVPVVPIIPVM